MRREKEIFENEIVTQQCRRRVVTDGIQGPWTPGPHPERQEAPPGTPGLTLGPLLRIYREHSDFLPLDPPLNPPMSLSAISIKAFEV